MGDGTQICRGSDSWKKLITENIDWLLKQPRTLERDHIEVMLRESLITPPSDGAGAFLKCPKCNDGIAGTDHTGEACDCHYCDGTGRITAEEFVEQRDRMETIIGDNMTYEILAEESKSIESSLAEAINHLFTLNDTVSIVSYDAPDRSKTLYRIEDEIGDYLTDGHDTWQAAVLATNLERTDR